MCSLACNMMGIHFTHSGGSVPPGHKSMDFLWKLLNLRGHVYQTMSDVIYIDTPLLPRLYSQLLDSTYFCDGCLGELDLKI